MARRRLRASRFFRSSHRMSESLEPRLLLSTYTVTSVNDSGPGTLRDAIQNSTADTVIFNLGPGAQTTLLSSQLEIARNLTITGPGASVLTLDGNHSTRIFQVDAGVTVEIDGLTIANGAAPPGNAANPDGTPPQAGSNGGGILSLATLTLRDDAIVGNRAGAGGNGGQLGGYQAPGASGGSGGGIFSAGSLTLVGDTLSQNGAGAGGSGVQSASQPNVGGDGGSGGGIYCSAALVVVKCLIQGNDAGAGGANQSEGGGGGAGGSGGGLFAGNGLVCSDSTMSGNSAGAGGVSTGNSALLPRAWGGRGGSGGGAFVQQGETTLTRMFIESNAAGHGGNVSGVGLVPSFGLVGPTGGAGGDGGGLWAAGATSMVLTQVSDNSAGNGGVGGDGGAGKPSASNGVFTSPPGPGAAGGAGGAAGSGGGVYAVSLSMSGGSINGNRAGNAGEGGAGGSGGAADPSSPGSTVGPGGAGGGGGTAGNGGGIYATGELTAWNETITSNSAGAGGTGGWGGAGGVGTQQGNGGAGGRGGAGGSGGAIFDPAGILLINDTVAANSGGYGGSGGAGGAGIVFGSAGTSGDNGVAGGIDCGETGPGGLTASNSIVAQNVVTMFAQNTFTTSPSDILCQNVESRGHNLIGATDGSSGWVASDLTGTAASPLDPRLAPVGDYGGPTDTMALIPNSPAIDAGDDALAVDPTSSPSTPLTADQRGLPRIVGSHVDIGAFEFEPTLTVNTLAGAPSEYGSLSLASAINLANADPTPNTISFAPGQSGVLSMAGPLALSGDLTILGPGARQLSFPYGLEVGAGALVRLSGVSLSGPSANSTVEGILTLTDCTFSGVVENSAMSVLPNARVIATGCTFSNNAGGSGGAINTLGVLQLANCTFSGNSAASGGAITFLGGQATLLNCTISGNVAPTAGGIYVGGGTSLALENTIVAGNLPGAGFPGASDIRGPIDPSSSHNLIGTGGSGGLVNGVNGNVVGVADPSLGPLADNGGPTQTMALLAGSPAIDAGSNALAAVLSTDQRGEPRVANGTVDIGAFELGNVIPPIPGDINGDGTVNFADLLTLAQNYGATHATWVQGDLNGDGTVGFDDLLVLAQHYGNSASSPVAAADSTFVSQPLRLRAGQTPRRR